MALVTVNVDVRDLTDGPVADAKSASAASSGAVVDAAIADALAAAGALHDSTPEIEAIETALATERADLALDVSLVIDNATVTTMNQLNAAVSAALNAARSSGKFTL